MPTYEYECTRCEHRFEKFQSMTDEPLKRCPKCRSKIRRVFGTGAGIIFKGSGFYETDYRSDNYKKAAKSESAGSSKDTTSSSDSNSGSKSSATKSSETKSSAKKD